MTVKLPTITNVQSKIIVKVNVCGCKKVKVFYPPHIITSTIVETGFSKQTLFFDPPSGSFFSLGLTQVTVIDGSGNIFTFLVNVVQCCKKKEEL